MSRKEEKRVLAFGIERRRSKANGLHFVHNKQALEKQMEKPLETERERETKTKERERTH